MSRKPRVFSEKGVYHVILRGNNRQDLFHDDQDREFFLQRLSKYSHELKISIYAYCLMTNHVHILIGQADRNMSLLVQKLANSYVFYFNRKYERSGHLFQGRFKSEPILDDEYFRTVYRYILQNCEKANLGKYCEYRWNSFKVLEEDSEGDFLDTCYVIDLFAGKRVLLEFLQQTNPNNCMEYESRILLTDDSVCRIIKKIFNIKNPYNLERLHVDEQINKCKVLKERGFSVSQISRVTGISKGIIKVA